MSAVYVVFEALQGPQVLHFGVLVKLQRVLDASFVLTNHLQAQVVDAFVLDQPQEVLDLDDRGDTIGSALLFVRGVTQFQSMQQLREVANLTANQILFDWRQRHQYLPEDVFELTVLIGFVVKLLVVQFEAARQYKFLK